MIWWRLSRLPFAFCGRLVGVERHAHGAVADRMRMKLQVGLVAGDRDLVQLLRREQQLAAELEPT